MISNHDVLGALIDVMQHTNWQIVDVVKLEWSTDFDATGKFTYIGFQRYYEINITNPVFNHAFTSENEMLFPIENNEYVRVKYEPK